MYAFKREYYLKHHGILGQKWGQKNGPPYPLDSSKSTGKRLKKDKRNSSTEKKKSLFKKRNKENKLSKDQLNEIGRIIKKYADKNYDEYPASLYKDVENVIDGYNKNEYGDYVKSVKNTKTKIKFNGDNENLTEVRKIAKEVESKSEEIINDCAKLAADSIYNRGYLEEKKVSKENFINYLKKSTDSSIRVTGYEDEVIVTFNDNKYTYHYPSIEYSFKKKKSFGVSIDG